MNKKLIILSIALLFLPFAALALNTITLPPDQIDKISVEKIYDELFIYIIWPVVSIVVVLSFVLAGFLFLTSKGEPAKIDLAKKAVIWGTVGVAVILLSYSAIVIVKSLIGVPDQPPPP